MTRFHATLLTRLSRLALALGLLTAAGSSLVAMDPPHNISVANSYGSLNYCSGCHKLHGALGGTLTKTSGNTNLCLSCHVSGGWAAAKALVAAEQGLPAWGLPSGVVPAGTSHRWDSGPQGHITFKGGAATASTGTLKPSGVYSGAYPTTLEIKITVIGNAGTAQFQWRSTSVIGAWGTASANIATATTPVAIPGMGVSVAFANGAGTSFQLNDVWHLYIRTDLRAPTNAAMAPRQENGAIMCSTCHDQHLQVNAPFDPAASPTYTAGTTNNRHFQRVANNANALCADCHAARAVGVGGGSHPVGVVVSGTNLKAPPTAPLVVRTDNTVQCLTCHDIHKAPTTDGSLLRVSYQTSGGNPLCVNCHTLAYTPGPTAGGHFNTTTGALWPGDKFGTNKSTYPAITDPTLKGACKTCHAPHGWRNADTAPATLNYSKLLGARQDNLCESCHDGTVAGAPNVRAEFVKLNEHPIDRTSGRMVACGDCHNPHMAINGSHVYATTATVDRNRIRNATGTTFYSGALKGADGVQFNYPGLANWATPLPAWFTKLASGSPAVPISGAEFEYQVCFKCHTSYDSYGATRPGGITNYYNTGTAKFTNPSTTVTGTGTTWTAAMVGMYIQKNVASPAYRITAATALSITLASAYTGVSDVSAAPYTITKQQTDLAQEFNPANASFHPVVVGLNSGTGNGTSNKALTSAQMKGPWTVLGTQTMMCSDCHNTDAASPAAQGPHGSAAQFMLRGPVALWPPTPAMGNFNGATLYNTTFCSNCHTYTQNNLAHKEHEGRTVTCYNCHILVPHGGKLARLIGDGNSATFPARYAYQNDKTKMWVTGFTKKAPGSYGTGDCGATCDSSRHNLANGAQW